MDDLRLFTIDTFTPLVGDHFRIRPEVGAPIEARLVSVEPCGGSARGRVPFSIVFGAPFPPALVQKTYRVEHEQLGGFDLFIVPIGPDDTGMRYEAVFG